MLFIYIMKIYLFCDYVSRKQTNAINKNNNIFVDKYSKQRSVKINQFKTQREQ